MSTKAYTRSVEKQSEYFQNQLIAAEKIFNHIMEFATLGWIPADLAPDYGSTLKPWAQGGELQFFSKEVGQPVFLYLIGQLRSTATSSKPRLGFWKKPSNAMSPLAQAQAQTEEGEEEPTVTVSAAPTGRIARFGSFIGDMAHGVSNLMSGPEPSDFDESEFEEKEDPYNHIAVIYNEGVIYTKTENYGAGAAESRLREVRNAIVMYVAVQVADTRHYINEKVSETGHGLVTMASA